MKMFILSALLVLAQTVHADTTATDAQLVAFQDLLRQPGVLTLPAIAKKNGAELMELSVKIVPLADDSSAALKSLVQGQIQSVLETYNYDRKVDASSLTALDFLDGDIHASLKTGFQDKEIEAYLLSMIKSSGRDKVREILSSDSLKAQYVSLSIYDVGSEIVGDELLIVLPMQATNALVIHLGYAQN